jgi:hypothetical protein
VHETSTTTGAGTYTLAGAVTGFQSFAAVADGNSCYYCAQEVDSNGNPSGGWEVGIGTYTAAGTTLSRDSITASSNGGSAVSWAAGTRRIFLVSPAAQAPPRNIVAGSVAVAGSRVLESYHGNLGTGDTDLYTAPTGKRALLLPARAANFNPANGTVTAYLQVKVSGTYYRINANTAVVVTVGTSLTAGGIGSGPVILEPGESIAINCATNTGLNLWLGLIEFDTSAPYKTVKVLGPSTGDNTLYTCPAGKSTWGTSLTAPIGLTFVSDAGGARTVTSYHVPSGQAIGTAYKTSAAVSVSASNAAGFLVGSSLGPSDFLAFNVDTGNAAQIAWATIAEFDSTYGV